MIKFNKETHKVENIGILEKAEARAYLEFLDSEKDRHSRNIVEAEQAVDAIGMWPDKQEGYDKALELFWWSAVRRHKEDIEAIDVLVETVEGFYKL